MPRISKNITAVLVTVICVVIFAGLKWYSQNSANNAVTAKELPARVKGHPDAKIKIVEFIDFQCPACAKGYKLLHEYMQKYPDQIYVELRYYPLKMHQFGLLSAQWAECASRQGKFWPFLDRIMEQQKEWSAQVSAIPAFTAIAKETGVDVDGLTACLQDESVNEAIKIDQEEGTLRNVVSTPSYLINHEMIVGALNLQKKMDELLGVTK